MLHSGRDKLDSSGKIMEFCRKRQLFEMLATAASCSDDKEFCSPLVAKKGLGAFLSPSSNSENILIDAATCLLHASLLANRKLEKFPSCWKLYQTCCPAQLH